MIITLNKKEVDEILMGHLKRVYMSVLPEGHEVVITRKYTDDIEIAFYPVEES